MQIGARARAFLERTRDPLVVRWLWLRSLGLIYVSVFWSLWGQIHGLIGPHGILPATDYLATLRGGMTVVARLWYAPTLLWLSAGDGALTALVVVGAVASLALSANLAPRLALAVASLAFLSFIGAAQEFASYQSDGMLLEASAWSLWLAPGGLRPGLAADRPPAGAAVWLLRWEWFRIYFESGLVKLFSGEEQWRALTAMVKYYENSPLPTWIGWYAQERLPYHFHIATALLTLALELVLPFTMFLGRNIRISAFAIFTIFQTGIILTGNYAFLNYLVLLLGVLLLCETPPLARPGRRKRAGWIVAGLYVGATIFGFLGAGALRWPARLLAPFRLAESYGLFAVMTRARYEIEFQGTLDGEHWVAYPFRYKPQDIDSAPGIYAPYQPRFEWNLWFASLGDVADSPWVVAVQERLLAGEPSVLRLFAGDPFGGRRPRAVRAIEWQYWFTTPSQKRTSGGAWWRRQEVGLYAPPLPAARVMQSP